MVKWPRVSVNTGSADIGGKEDKTKSNVQK
jgi:hypothetical protein